MTREEVVLTHNEKGMKKAMEDKPKVEHHKEKAMRVHHCN